RSFSFSLFYSSLVSSFQQVPCIRKFKILSSKIHSSTTFEKAQYDTVETRTAKSKERSPPFNWWRACIDFGGQCKTKCGEREFGMSHCGMPATHCCLKECEPEE
uniref:Beta-defensin n=1 Tax=Equus caballus TaxID=9796 RepID=A0A3Q2LRA9_HORSE